MKIKQSGITLVETLIVVAVIAILTTIVVGIATHISNQSKKQLTKNTFALLNAALGQFRDYEYRYEHPDYYDFDFPLDCNGLSQLQLEITLEAVNPIYTKLGLAPGNVSISGGVHDPNYSGSEVLYFFLNKLPTSRQTLEKIDDSLITNLSFDKQPMEIIINKRIYPLLRIVDPWGTTLHYDYYNELMPDPVLRNKGKRNFPAIISAGPDRIFRTGDDITNH
ncbi:hypothetical protein ES703_47151 [subsurface metagenome]